jgi:hypothetical protein
MVLPVAWANALTLYEDPTTGQVFTRPAEGRVEIDSFPGTEPAAPAPQAAEQKAVPAAPAEKKQADADDDDDFGNGITILNPKSPEFPLGQETQINMKFVPSNDRDMYFKAGVRIQGSLENLQTDFDEADQTDTNLSDAYLRRARLEVGAGFGKHVSFTMDIRSDRVNQGFRDEGEFRIGDAYVDIKKPFDSSLVNFKLYRAKIDVSRSETIKSARLVEYDRPFVADYAANFISFNRRAANVQMYGDWKKKIHYQIATGDAIDGDELNSFLGEEKFDITDQSLFYGGKVVFSPFNGWEETLKTETYMGQGKHFSFGAAYWTVPSIEGTTKPADPANTAAFDLNHELINIEASAHYKGFFIQSEYFKFKDVVEKWDVAELNIGESKGWYVLSEYVMPNFYYIAPFVRYEDWDTFEGEEGNDVKSTSVGVNWYLRGNTTKVGLVYQTSEFGSNIGCAQDVDCARDVNSIRLTSQFFF